MKKILFSILTSFAFGLVAVSAQSVTPVSEKDLGTELDNYIRQTMQAIPELPSVAMVVVKDDKPIFIRAYGFTNRETGAKADANSAYYIASSTKSYMALAAALLDREGKIKLSDPVVKYLPGVTFKTPIPEKVTVRDLLTHTSALRNGALIWRTAYTGEVDDKDLLNVLAGGTTFDEANYGKYAYTNLGYNIYGILVRQTLGKKWQDVLQEKIFGPLGLKQTSAYVSKLRSVKMSVADSYLFDPAAKSVIRSPIAKMDNNMQAAGGIYTSLNDMARWLSFNMNDGKLDGKQVIPADIVQAVHTGYADTTRDQPPFSGNGKYGLGWQIGKYRQEKVVYHHGGYAGWSTHVSYMPDKKIGVAVLINESTVGGRITHLFATYAYDRLLGTDTAENYAKQLQEIGQQYARIKDQMVGAVASRADRKSQLTKPLTDYAGRYSNDLLGNIDISVEQNTLLVRMGYVRVMSTPYTGKDSIRVEMDPGRGEVITFNFNVAGLVDSLSYGDMKFSRVKS